MCCVSCRAPQHICFEHMNEVFGNKEVYDGDEWASAHRYKMYPKADHEFDPCVGCAGKGKSEICLKLGDRCIEDKIIWLHEDDVAFYAKH